MKQQQKTRFTIIDLLIILVVLAALAIGVVKIFPNMFSGGEKDTVEFTVMVTGKESGFSQMIHEGDKVSLSYEEKDSGVVTGVRAETAKTMTYNSIDGKYSISEVEGQEDIYITVQAKATVSDLVIKTGETAVKVGKQMPVRGKGYVTNGFVVDTKLPAQN